MDILILQRPLRRALSWCGLVLLATWCFTPGSTLGAALQSRLAAGEIIYHSERVPGSPFRRGEASGLVNAPPEKVWEVITDVNHYHEFMPKMVKSQAVGLDRLKIIQQRRPTSAAAVEAILGPTPPNPALLRVPGQKYVSYFYGHLKVPFPLADRWYIVKVVWDETQAAQHIFTCSWYFMIGNLREYSGEWKVKPFGDNQTHLTYRVVTDPGGFVPKFIVKDFTTKILPKVIAGVRKRVAYR